MILFNTTFHLDSSIESELLMWLRQRFIPETLAAGMERPLLCRLIENVEPGCSAFALQFFCDSIADVDGWRSSGFLQLMTELSEKWKDRALAFSTSMEVIDL